MILSLLQAYLPKCFAGWLRTGASQQQALREGMYRFRAISETAASLDVTDQQDQEEGQTERRRGEPRPRWGKQSPWWTKKSGPKPLDLKGLTMTDLMPALPLSSREALIRKGIITPSPIQALAIPHIGRKRHAVIHSETGSGKTLAYVLPSLERARLADEAAAAAAGKPITENQKSVVLIVTPTRELAVQVMSHCEDHSHGSNALIVTSARAAWGTIANAVVVIGTPKELLEVMDKEDAKDVKQFLERVEVCILDEFDELIPKRKFTGRKRPRYQKFGMWPTEGLLQRLIRNNERKHLQVLAVSATAYKQSQIKLGRILKKDKLARFPKGKLLTLIEPPLPEYIQQANPYEDEEEGWEGGTNVTTPTQQLDEGPFEDSAEDDGGEKDELGDEPEEQEEEEDDSPAEGDWPEEAEDGSLVKPRPSRTSRYPSLPPGISHVYWRTPVGAKHSNAVAAALDKIKPESALIFVCPNIGETVSDVVEDLRIAGWPNAEMLTKMLFPDSRSVSHRPTMRSGESKGWRSTRQFNNLNSLTRRGFSGTDGIFRDAPVLVTSEESVRGLDLDSVQAVFVLGMPKSAASYLHMAGRTGRLPFPVGTSCLVARGREIEKVIRGFSMETSLTNWAELGRGSPALGTLADRLFQRIKKVEMRKRKDESNILEELERDKANAEGSGSKDSTEQANPGFIVRPPQPRSAAADKLDARLGLRRR